MTTTPTTIGQHADHHRRHGNTRLADRLDQHDPDEDAGFCQILLEMFLAQHPEQAGQ